MIVRRFVLSCAGAALVLAGCGADVQGKAPDAQDKKSPVFDKSAQEQLIPVQTAMPQRQDIAAYFETTARVMAEKRVEVLSKGIGQCLDVKVEVGDQVKEGDVLAELDGRELQAQIKQTQVNVAQTKARMDLASRSFKEGLGPEVEFTNAKFAWEAAAAVLDLQGVQLSNQIIKAPIAGVITQKLLQPGMVVSTGMPTFSIVDPNTFILPVNVPEKELTRLKAGQTAKVSIDSVAGKEFGATVDRINPAVDPASGTIIVKLAFEETARPFLREASFARVRLIMETHPQALVVPKDTLLEENARKYLMTVQPDPAGKPDRLLAKRVEVETGLEDSNVVEITKGIEEGTPIVTLGQHNLKNDTAVTITNADAAAKPKTAA